MFLKSIINFADHVGVANLLRVSETVPDTRPGCFKYNEAISKSMKKSTIYI